jgi:hexosaminidase
VGNATLTASSVEENAATLAASKAGDGDTSTQWSSDSLTSSEAGATQWLKAACSEVTQIKQIKVKFHVRNIDPSPANVSSFSIKYTDANGELKVAKENYAVPASGNGYATEVSIVLDEAIMAKELQLCDFRVKIGSTKWNSVGIAELEAYAESGAVSLDEVVSAVEGTADTTIEYRFKLPEVPAGYKIEMNGADFEQIVSNDLKVSIPLVDKEVKISYKITETATGETVITDDITYLVKGENEMEEGVNEKPVVIPEIQEWYAWSDQKLNTSALTKVGYNDDSLEAIVEEFAGDYKRITDKNLEMVKGDMESGMIYFKKDAEAPFYL